MRWRAILAGVLVLLLIFLAILCFPFKMAIVPSWHLRVVDDAGIAVRDINVTEHWQHYLVESEGHDEVRQPDQGGRVEFPERTVRASVVTKALAKLRRFGGTGEPARSDPYASIVVWGNRDYETVVAVYVLDTPLRSEVVVHRRR